METTRTSLWYQGKHALSLLLVLNMILTMLPAIPAVADDTPDDVYSGEFMAESQQADGESQDDPDERKASDNPVLTTSAGKTGKDTQEEYDEEVTTCDAIEVKIENHAAGNLATEIEAYLDAMGCPDAYDCIFSLKVSGGELSKADQDYLRQTFWYKCDYLEDVDFSDTSLAYDEGIEMRPGLFESTSIIKIKLPDNLTAISDAAFSGSIFLAIVEIPESVTSIGAGAFLGCECLLAIDLPEMPYLLRSGAIS
ncbi:MAG TPA: leucine-rich repeat domain-containing protein [Thermoclostridium caenicola]|nr:leucine-rich repeat domain-containing protein [Thermoclostridium caenicola]